ncbi:alpha-humulene/(-)-(E)-beta-caryophyllene synthase [Citrus sinensis]|nr:alpha-humulene/(-)-(E)-beta-caryophyllene synthase [Citrus sinensis]
MMASDADKPAQKLCLIDVVQRLGVAYHFIKEIDDALEKISHDPFDDKDDIYIVSLCFRLLRQHGIKMSCDVFEKFKDDDGKFKASLTNDVEGMLSLYEVNSTFAEQIRHSLRVPLRRAVSRLESRYFLDIYSRDDLHDKTLLNFAKLDFNILQAMHQKEASEITREIFEWEMSNPDIIIAAETIIRFLDDIAGHKFEQKREHNPSAVECYKNQHGVSEEEAVKALSLAVANSWKVINEELLLNPTAIPLPLLQSFSSFIATKDRHNSSDSDDATNEQNSYHYDNVNNDDNGENLDDSIDVNNDEDKLSVSDDVDNEQNSNDFDNVNNVDNGENSDNSVGVNNDEDMVVSEATWQHDGKESKCPFICALLKKLPPKKFNIPLGKYREFDKTCVFNDNDFSIYHLMRNEDLAIKDVPIAKLIDIENQLKESKNTVGEIMDEIRELYYVGVDSAQGKERDENEDSEEKIENS